jgi:hypothetical protein
MGTTDSKRAGWIMAVLALLMAATRFHHEGTPFAPPDASLAVFFLLGWYSGSRAAFAGFLLGACAIDYAAIGYGGVSDYCVTPAYGFLIPTYAAMWGTGRWSAGFRTADGLPWLRAGAALTAAATVAFVISSGSFFLLSGRLDGADGMAYILGVARDYPAYLSAAAMYCGLAFLLEGLFRRLPVLDRWAKAR